jgi:hypothetical protein
MHPLTTTRTPRRPPPKIGQSMSEWLDQWSFDRFVTLATNDAHTFGDHDRGPQLMRQRLREWDARINRKLVGPKWCQRPEDRIWAFYFLEKPETNPHWHGLIAFFPPWDCREQYELNFDLWAPVYWKQLVPSATIDIQKISDQKNVSRYVVKSIRNDVSYRNFVLPDEL